MPLYEYYCESCDGVFETLRSIREASEPSPCPLCDRDGMRIMPTSFAAFTFRDGMARRLMGETPGLKDMKMIRSGGLRIANQQGHEILVEAKDAKSGTEVQAVQWLRFGSGTLLRIVGVARKDGWDATFARFRKVRDGVGPK